MNKDHILSEIRRTASTNKSTALGAQRFFTETGIKRSDWLGRYWARWGDALREAGLSPNQFQKAHDEGDLLEKYIAAVRELGRFPTGAELRMRKRSDPTFPTHNVFNRFGSKLALIERLAIFCEAHGKYEDIRKLCKDYIARAPEEAKISTEANEDIGFVYLVKSGKFHKIGKSNSAGRRQYELDIQLPERATKVHAIRTDDPSGIEAYWHNRFKAKRKNGEWFDLAASDIGAFKRRKFM